MKYIDKVDNFFTLGGQPKLLCGLNKDHNL